MIRDTFVMRRDSRGKLRLVPKRLAPPRIARNDPKVYVIGDVMEPLRHMATGRIHDSKSRFRADTRATGCVEVGTDPAARRPGKPYQPPDLVPYVQRAIAELESR
jgi:hypothetical protein